jgi:hypothetical protein
MILACKINFMLIFKSLNVRCIETNIYFTMVLSIEGKLLHSYEHCYQVELHALEHVIQTLPNGPLTMKTSFENLIFDTLGCNKALALSTLHSSPQPRRLIS